MFSTPIEKAAEQQDKEKENREAAFGQILELIADTNCGEKKDVLRQVEKEQKAAKEAYRAARQEYRRARDKAVWGRIKKMKSVQSEAGRQHDYLEKIADAVSASLVDKGCSTT